MRVPHGIDLDDAEWLARALTDEGVEKSIKFGYTNGATLWRMVLAAAADKLRGMGARGVGSGRRNGRGKTHVEGSEVTA